MVKKLGIILFFVYSLTFLVSCDPIKRHARLVKKYPHVHTQDTIKMVDTIRIEVPKISVDSFFQIDSFLLELRDTIKVEKERLKIKMYAVHDSVFIEGTCDTIFVEKIIERKIPIRYYEAKKENDFKKWSGIILISFLIILILLIVYRLFKFFL